MTRITRADRQVYIARAVLADHRYVEAHFDSWEHIELVGAEPVQIAHDRVTLVHNAATYLPTLYGVWDRGDGPAMEQITEAERRVLARRADGYATVAYDRYDNGLWYLRVTTPRGSYDVPRIPFELSEALLQAAGLGTVP